MEYWLGDYALTGALDGRDCALTGALDGRDCALTGALDGRPPGGLHH